MVFWYTVYRFIVVETRISTKSIWELVFENLAGRLFVYGRPSPAPAAPHFVFLITL